MIRALGRISRMKPDGSDEALDARILRSSAQAYPMVTSVRVKDALEAVNDV